ncbi:MAG TPA: hypothetical protein VI168_16770 [Croceibacterium sp.]
MRPDPRLLPALGALFLAAGCTTTAIPTPRQEAPASGPRIDVPVPPTRPAPPPVTDARAPQIQRLPGLEEVIEQDAASLARRFGEPRLDVREGDMRKLQFAGEPCVLDVFLYPLREGAEPVATYVEARRVSDGQAVDRAACVAALRR